MIKQPKFERLDKLLSKTRKNAVRLQLPMLQRKRHLRKERKKLVQDKSMQKSVQMKDGDSLTDREQERFCSKVLSNY